MVIMVDALLMEEIKEVTVPRCGYVVCAGG
jgi:hypothetical protein